MQGRRWSRRVCTGCPIAPPPRNPGAAVHRRERDHGGQPDRVAQAVAGPDVDPHFGYIEADRLEVSEVACLGALDPTPYRHSRPQVLEARTPLGEGYGLLDDVTHEPIVSNAIQGAQVRYVRMGNLVPSPAPLCRIVRWDVCQKRLDSLHPSRQVRLVQTTMARNACSIRGGGLKAPIADDRTSVQYLHTQVEASLNACELRMLSRPKLRMHRLDLLQKAPQLAGHHAPCPL